MKLISNNLKPASKSFKSKSKFLKPAPHFHLPFHQHLTLAATAKAVLRALSLLIRAMQATGKVGGLL